MNEAWRAAFGDTPPARTTVTVKDLVLEARVEVECVARRRGA
jgi:enamine deaminase RidA (YjgF/YER057c/UK114 family)